MRELSLHILDILENSVEAGATRIEIVIDEDMEADRMTIEVADNGRGMTTEMAKAVLSPFVTTRKTRHVGLGLPLLAAAARRCAGDLTIESEIGKGTRITATFRHSHVDRAPLGDVPTALIAILLSEHPVDLGFTHKVNSEEFQFDSAEIRQELEDVPLTHPLVRPWLLETLNEGEASLRANRPQTRITL